MSHHHRYLSVAELSIGMVLADELLDKLGHVLLPAGTKLNEHMIRSIPHHDIHHVSVFSQPSAEEENQSHVEQQHKLDRVDLIFLHSPYNDATETLKAHIKKYRAAALS